MRAAQALEAVELAGAARAAGGQEGEHERPALGELAEVEDAGAADAARGPVAGRALPGGAGNVDVAVDAAEGQRRRERRRLGAHLQPARADAVAAERVQRDIGEHEDGDHADEPAVAARSGRQAGRRGGRPAHVAQGRARIPGRRTAPPRRPCSASTSTAGSTSMTPSSATVRSTTVTKPKSRSMRMSDTTSTAKPAIAVVPEARTAAPVER